MKKNYLKCKLNSASIVFLVFKLKVNLESEEIGD